jgi:hypothetical protein
MRTPGLDELESTGPRYRLVWARKHADIISDFYLAGYDVSCF